MYHLLKEVSDLQDWYARTAEDLSRRELQLEYYNSRAQQSGDGVYDACFTDQENDSVGEHYVAIDPNLDAKDASKVAVWYRALKPPRIVQATAFAFNSQRAPDEPEVTNQFTVEDVMNVLAEGSILLRKFSEVSGAESLVHVRLRPMKDRSLSGSILNYKADPEPTYFFTVVDDDRLNHQCGFYYGSRGVSLAHTSVSAPIPCASAGSDSQNDSAIGSNPSEGAALTGQPHTFLAEQASDSVTSFASTAGADDFRDLKVELRGDLVSIWIDDELRVDSAPIDPSVVANGQVGLLSAGGAAEFADFSLGAPESLFGAIDARGLRPVWHVTEVNKKRPNHAEEVFLSPSLGLDDQPRTPLPNPHCLRFEPRIPLLSDLVPISLAGAAEYRAQASDPRSSPSSWQLVMPDSEPRSLGHQLPDPAIWRVNNSPVPAALEVKDIFCAPPILFRTTIYFETDGSAGHMLTLQNDDHDAGGTNSGASSNAESSSLSPKIKVGSRQLSILLESVSQTLRVQSISATGEKETWGQRRVKEGTVNVYASVFLETLIDTRGDLTVKVNDQGALTIRRFVPPLSQLRPALYVARGSVAFSKIQFLPKSS